MADVYIFIVDAGAIGPSAFLENSVSPFVSDTTTAPHWPLRVRLSRALPRVLANSAGPSVTDQAGALGVAGLAERAGGFVARAFVDVGATDFDGTLDADLAGAVAG